MTLIRSRVTNNGGNNPEAGGGIYARGRVKAIDSFILDNQASTGGGVYAMGQEAYSQPHDPEEAVVTLSGSAVGGNAALSDGAALFSFGPVSITGASVSDNSLPPNSTSAAIIAFANGVNDDLWVSDSVLARNTGEASSVVRLEDGQSQDRVVDLLRTQVIDNQMNGVFATSVVDSVVARNAGTGVIGGVDLLVRGSTIRGNGGGGVTGGTVDLIDSVVRGNGVSPTPYSQRVSGVRAGTLLALRSTIADNVAQGYFASGGGVEADRVFLYGSTVSGNVAVGEGAKGGGVFAKIWMETYQSTISGNRVEGADTRGGASTPVGCTHSIQPSWTTTLWVLTPAREASTRTRSTDSRAWSWRTTQPMVRRPTSSRRRSTRGGSTTR